MNLETVRILAVIVPMVFTANGCATAVVAGAAAAGGYIAHEKGYRIRNPVTSSGEKKETKNK